MCTVILRSGTHVSFRHGHTRTTPNHVSLHMDFGFRTQPTSARTPQCSTCALLLVCHVGSTHRQSSACFVCDPQHEQRIRYSSPCSLLPVPCSRLSPCHSEPPRPQGRVGESPPPRRASSHRVHHQSGGGLMDGEGARERRDWPRCGALRGPGAWRRNPLACGIAKAIEACGWGGG